MTTHRIVTVGVDGSATSTVALGWAAREAVRREAELRVLHTFSVPVYSGGYGTTVAMTVVDFDEYRKMHEDLVDHQLAAIRTAYPSLVIETHVVSGAPVPTIVEGAKDAELAVVGSRGTGSLAALLIGSVAHGVAHRAPCPVVLVPDVTLRPTVGTIVVGTDGSAAAGAAIDWAAEEARLWGAELTVAHAWQYPYSTAGVSALGGAAAMEVDAARLLADAALRFDASRAHAAEVRTVLLHGAPATVLVDASADRDLLVLGARGLNAFKSLLLGSTSNQAIHHARCPIAIIHNPDAR